MRREFNQKEFGGMRGGALAAVLIKHGYRRVSNRHRSIARVDCADWKKNGHGATLDPDFYRRVLSQDLIDDVPLDVYTLIPSSDNDPVEYVE